MAAELIDGKEIARKKQDHIGSEVQKLKEEGITPGLAVILAGNNQASRTYVKNKQKTCDKLGMNSMLIELSENVSEQELIIRITELNENEDIHGILVQLPLPSHINEKAIIEAISPEKDVDGFHPINIGRMMTAQDAYIPCTPAGIIEMLDSIGADISGKHVVVIGRSNIVGKPAGQLFLNEDATVTYCHSKTADLKEYTKRADILVAAAGKANLITEDHVKNGAIVIDVGMNRDGEGKLCGDVDFDAVRQKAGFITPVPGGVGPMTIAMLMHNTLKAAKLSKSKI
ncbi:MULTISPECIES: bifunctional methylenetetrahydrofolate dehydrogenase/methenyltetrahydrofolate cyclohydrolase FolD [Bacillaceae]|uniref:bifunctional methylenetetrahydrofolate dehydrogenase/methenyltetrahydrofolate cyclohydrolase FolD n=1 Tax=Bacillaceae TaxID=186817 RepID=UPI001A8F71FC|nr:bifunctional methylenetetrahydrofolate dehydrogenase/methenyltetrahydrofolate cyclohydrolase FolD [Bacillus sp. NTK034]MBN8200426.1 bifunctional methylenetetrahydrofolate dehydrogenase/methenyltetrahydrofolate cyclohydrolase FolD [Bacillus sp. NTK034]